MIKPNQFKLSTQAALVVTLLLGASQSAFSHTRLEIPTVVEGIRASNNVVIGHACGEGTNVVAHTSVFPDGVDSIIKVDGVEVTGSASDYVTNYGNLNQKIMNHSVFANEDEKTDASANVVGFWVEGGKNPNHYATYVPFRSTAGFIEPSSCASSVKVIIAVADICKVTAASGFADTTVNLWTPAVGSNFDGPGLHGFNSPASITYTRNLETNPLPEGCSETGSTVEIIPSAAQLNRDMPIIKKGKQFWPKVGH